MGRGRSWRPRAPAVIGRVRVASVRARQLGEDGAMGCSPHSVGWDVRSRRSRSGPRLERDGGLSGARVTGLGWRNRGRSSGRGAREGLQVGVVRDKGPQRGGGVHVGVILVALATVFAPCRSAGWGPIDRVNVVGQRFSRTELAGSLPPAEGGRYMQGRPFGHHRDEIEEFFGGARVTDDAELRAHIGRVVVGHCQREP